MSHVYRDSYDDTMELVSAVSVQTIISQRKWKTVKIHISDEDLANNIKFLNDAVVLRASPEGVPLMTTTAIYGPIKPGDKVALTPGEGTGVKIINGGERSSLIVELEMLFLENTTTEKDTSVTINANWVSAEDGGGVPALDSASNVFGGTGSLYVNERAVTLPVLDKTHPFYHETLAFYGAKLLDPGEEFYMGFDKVLFGVEYDTSLPDYIRNYAMSPSGGGGLFVEHHPFPHIFWPRKDENKNTLCEAKVTLGRQVEGNEKKNPQFTFTTFRIPSDGSALAIRPSTIHNDSFTNGMLAVFVANTDADTVAFRETAPFTNISVKDQY